MKVGQEMTRHVVALVCLGAVLAYFMFRIFPLPEQGLWDLNAYLRGGRAILAGTDPYEPGFPMFGYAPAVAIGFVPLALLDLALANLVWFWLSFCLVIACCAGIVYLTDSVINSGFVLKWLILLCIAFAMYPVYANASFGQINAVTFSFFILSLILLKKGHARMGGVALGVSAAVKFVPLVFIAHAIWKRNYAYGISALIAFIAIQLAPAVFVPQVFESFWVTKVPTMVGLEDAFNGSLANLTAVWTGGNTIAIWGARLIALGALGLPFLLFVRQRGILLIEVALLIAATGLFGPVVLNHHLLWALLPVWVGVRLVYERRSKIGLASMAFALLLYSQPFRITRILERFTSIVFPPEPLQGGTILLVGTASLYVTLLAVALTHGAIHKGNQGEDAAFHPIFRDGADATIELHTPALPATSSGQSVP